MNGEAIYGTRPWTRAMGTSLEGLDIRFTTSGDAVYAIAPGRPPARSLTILDFPVAGEPVIEMLGHHAPLDWRTVGADLEVTLPAEPIDTPALALRIRG